MWNLALQVLVIVLFQCGVAVRQDIAKQVNRERIAEDTGNVRVKNMPMGAYNAVHAMAPRQCQLMYFAQFVNDYDAEWFTAALEESYASTENLNMNRIEEDDGIDAEEWPACAPGSLVMDCARTLKPAMWLQQKWVLKARIEIHENAWYCPWCKTPDADFDTEAVEARKHLFSRAVKKAGFDAKAADGLCKEEVMKEHDPMQLRECMVQKASMLELSTVDQALLMEYLTGWWSYKDSAKRNKLILNHFGFMKRAKMHAKDWFGARSGTKYLRLRYQAKAGMKALGFNYAKEKAACLPSVTAAKESHVLDRIEEEVSNVCDKDKGCTEEPDIYCPEGTHCDCQRPYTPKRALTAFNTVFWVASPLTVAVVSGTIAYATAGTAAVPLAMWNAGWFPDYIPAVIAMAAFSRKWTPECMCFEMDCDYDDNLGQCTMMNVGKMRTSSNPFSWLPMNGLKCVRKIGSPDKCELKSCEEADVQVRKGAQLFGRLGYEGADLYNCANLKGDLNSQFIMLDSLPDESGGHGMQVNNSAKERNKFYDRIVPN